jgi:thiosulfate reductase cytochrome b subunit
MTGDVLRIPLWIRLWHGMTALLFIVLAATGIVLHFSHPRSTLISYATATTLHDLTGILLAVLYGIYLIAVIGTGYWRLYIPPRKGLCRRVKMQVIFYTVGLARNGTDAAPAAGTRFNALQQLTYLIVVFGLLPLLIATGLLYLYYPTYIPETVLGLAGLWPIALVHYALGILGTSYLVIHVYMATVGPNAGATLRLMTTGRGDLARTR